MATHALLSPSAAHRWFRCPGSVALTEGMPETVSAAAAEGTRAHDIAAKVLTGKGTLDECETDEMRAAVADYVNAVRAVASSDHAMDVEVRVYAMDGVHGTADALVWDLPRLHVFDFKFGAGVAVDVDYNLQALIYAVGALRSALPDVFLAVKRVTLHIIQPRHPRGGHQIQTLSVRELRQWQQLELEPAVRATQDPEAPLIPGTWCRWCRGKAQCPALRQHALTTAGHTFGPTKRTPPEPETLSTTELQQLLVAFPDVEQWIAAVRAHAYERAMRGESIPGYKIVHRTGHRRWHDEQETARVLEMLDVDPYVRKLKSPAQVERDAPELKSLVQHRAHKPSIGFGLVPLTDRRPERVSATDVFAAIDDNQTDGDPNGQTNGSD